MTVTITHNPYPIPIFVQSWVMGELTNANVIHNWIFFTTLVPKTNTINMKLVDILKKRA